jgi:hypothetical protein
LDTGIIPVGAAGASMLLGEAVGIGSADLAKIDVRCVPIKDAIFEF